MARAAEWLGREYQVLTDHSPRLTIANGLTAERLNEQLDVVAEVDAEHDDFRLLSGIEVDILDDGDLDQTDEMLGRLDVVVASVHSKLKMDRDRHDPADGQRDRQPAHQRARPLHRTARRRVTRGTRPVEVRRQEGVRRVREVRRRGRDQLAAGAAGPAEPT